MAAAATAVAQAVTSPPAASTNLGSSVDALRAAELLTRSQRKSHTEAARARTRASAALRAEKRAAARRSGTLQRSSRSRSSSGGGGGGGGGGAAGGGGGSSSGGGSGRQVRLSRSGEDGGSGAESAASSVYGFSSASEYDSGYASSASNASSQSSCSAMSPPRRTVDSQGGRAMPPSGGTSATTSSLGAMAARKLRSRRTARLNKGMGGTGSSRTGTLVPAPASAELHKGRSRTERSSLLLQRAAASADSAAQRLADAQLSSAERERRAAAARARVEMLAARARGPVDAASARKAALTMRSRAGQHGSADGARANFTPASVPSAAGDRMRVAVRGLKPRAPKAADLTVERQLREARERAQKRAAAQTKAGEKPGIW